jgi:GWxTD domain-containing protein
MIKEKSKKWILSLLVILTFSFTGLALQQSQEKQQKTEPEKKKEEKAPALSKKYQMWLDEEVVYIISESEKDVFKSLRTDQERENFIKIFWKRRDLTPETPVNEFREEHYRRIAYANERYFEGKAGWRTDRGRVYIMFGPPDFFETNPGGGRGFLFGAQAPTAEFPSEVWTYREIPGLKARIGRVDFTFVNYYAAGSYQLTSDPALANALRNVSLPARYAGYNDFPTTDGKPRSVAEVAGMDQKAYENPLEQLQIMAQLTKSRGEVLEDMERSARLRKLRGIVEAKTSLSGLLFYAKENYMIAGGGLTYIPLSLEIAARDLGFNKVKDRYQGLVNFYIEVKDEKETVYQTSDRLEMNLKEESYQRRFTDFYQYKQGLKLRPGKYYLHLVVWDELSGNVGYADRWIQVPAFSSKDFTTSDIILARDIQRLEAKPEEVMIESKNIPALKALEKTNLKVPEKISMVKQQRGGPYTFGNFDVNPNTLSEYAKDSELVFFYQIYNPTFNEVQGMAKVRIENQIWRGSEFVATIDQPQEVQVPIAQKATGGGLNNGVKYNLSNLAPGNYTLVVLVKDLFSGNTVEKRANFKIK